MVIQIYKYDGTLIEKFRCNNNKLNAAVWIKGRIY